MKSGVIEKCLDGGNGPSVWIAHSHPAAHRAHSRIAKAGGQFTDRLRMKNAIGVNGDDDFSLGVRESRALRARLAAVRRIASDSHGYVGEVVLRLEHPLVAIVSGAVVLRNDLQSVIGIVTVTAALDGVIDGLAL